MKNARAKTINLLLYEGSLKGVISIADSSWNSGELFSAPRESVDDLISSEACNKYGVLCWTVFRFGEKNKTTYHRKKLVGTSCNINQIG